MKGAISIHDQNYYTYMDRVFEAIGQAQLAYNWLLTNYECNRYPDERISFQQESGFVWLTGEDITNIVAKNHIQFIWGVFSGFDKSLKLDEILKYDLPNCNHKGYWVGKPSIQHPLAEIEIMPFDSSFVVLVSRNDLLAEEFVKTFPGSMDLEWYNFCRSISSLSPAPPSHPPASP